jgi:Xaa-Pro aminopeptidase
MGLRLTREGCAARQAALWDALPRHVEAVVVTAPEHLVWLVDFHASPYVFNGQNGTAALLLHRRGESVLITDNVQEPFAGEAYVSKTILPEWYRCVTDAGDRRGLVSLHVCEQLRSWGVASAAAELGHLPAAIVEAPGRWTELSPLFLRLRRSKWDDELAILRRCMLAADAGHSAALAGLRSGMTEHDVYRLVADAALAVAEEPILVYGDFASGPRCESGGGPVGNRTIQSGELLLLDFSVVIRGYRGDFCNTLLVEAEPTAEQRAWSDACLAAMTAGESNLHAGGVAAEVYQTVRGELEKHRFADRFPHHAGHGVGLGHPESPFLVPESREQLVAGDVVTLEPGLYFPGRGGVRFERNYLIRAAGKPPEVLSHLKLGLPPR